jgi:hypothetical protein
LGSGKGKKTEIEGKNWNSWDRGRVKTYSGIQAEKPESKNPRFDGRKDE